MDHAQIFILRAFCNNATMADAATRITSWADNKDTYQAGLMSLFSGKPEDTEADLQKLFTPTFTIRVPSDGNLFDFPTFVTHIRWLRENVPSVTLTITQFLRDGSQLAERHTSTTTMPDGSIGAAETFQFAEVAEDGRVAWIAETVVREKK